jgi:Tol biopolymer transport system component
MGWRLPPRRPAVAACTALVLVAAALVAVSVAVSVPTPSPRLVAAADGTIAAQRMAFFSEHHAALAERDYSVSPSPSPSSSDGGGVILGARGSVAGTAAPLFGEAPDDQPSGRNGWLAFVRYPVSGANDTGAGLPSKAGLSYWRTGSDPKDVVTEDSAVAEPDISPDGKEIVYAGQRSGVWDIFVVDVQSKKTRRITDDATEDSWPRWSPNGKSILFASKRDGTTGNIYVVPAAGGTPTLLTNDAGGDSQPAWSPGGDRIAFTTTRWHASGDVAVLPAAGGAVTRVAAGSEPVWSQKAKETGVIDFVDRGTRAGGEVYSVHVSAAGVPDQSPVLLTPAGAGGERHPTWVDANTLVTTYDAGWNHFLPEGASAGTRTADIWTAGIDGSDLSDLTRAPGLVERAPAYSPDGKHVAYQKEVPYPEEQSEGYIPHGFVIVVADLSGAIIWETRSTSTNADVDPAWSPDGSAIAFARKSIVGFEGYFVTGEIRVVNSASGADLATLDCMDINASGPASGPVAASGCDDGEPAWSPDGTRLAFTRVLSPNYVYTYSRLLDFEDNAARYSNIWVVAYTAQGPNIGKPAFGAQKHVSGVSGYTDLSPLWTPSGGSLIFVRDGRRMLSIPADGPDTDATEVTILDGTAYGVDLAGIATPTYSLDNRTLVFSAYAHVYGSEEGYFDSGTTAGFDDSDLYGITRDATTGAWGAPSVILSEPGEDSQPAFQPSADVGVNLQATPTSILLNDAGTSIQMTVTDHGWSSATNTTATVTVPAGLRVTGIRASSGTCVLAQLTCSLGTLDAGRSVTVTVDALGVLAGAAVVTGTATSSRFDPDPGDNTGRTSVIVGTSPDIAVAVSATPATAYVGGTPIAVTYTVTNRGSGDSTGSRLVVALPTDLVGSVTVTPAGAANCDTPLGTCVIGVLQPTVASGANAVTITVTLVPKAALNTVVSGTVSADLDSDPGDNTAQAPIGVLAPALAITPRTGEAGFVPRVVGTDFPPGALVVLAWDRGITQRTRPVTVTAGGTFTVPVMVFNRDLLGPRTLRATPAGTTPTGTTFAAVTSGYLVVSGHDQPDAWLYRR